MSYHKQEEVLNNFYRCNLGFDKEKFKDHMKKVEKLKKEMGDLYRLAKPIRKGEMK